MRFQPETFQSLLPLPATAKWPDGVWDTEAFAHGTMTLLYFAPQGKDYQSPHDQDELYIVISGSGTVQIQNESWAFKAGDALFVPANTQHRFVGALSDLRFWVVLYGEKGGERSTRRVSSSVPKDWSKA